MTARRITESYDGSTIAVDVTQVMGRLYVSVNTHEFDVGVDAVEVDRDTLVYLTPAETADLVEALNVALAELATTDTRPSAPPVAEGRGAGPSDLLIAGPGCTETAPVGAGAGTPTGETASDQGAALAALLPDGNTRTQAAGPSTASSGPGRPTCDDCSPFLCICGAVPGDELFVNELVVTEAEPPDVADPPGRPTLASMLGNARRELLANSTLIGPAGGEDR